jgi:transposase InsO family protein
MRALLVHRVRQQQWPPAEAAAAAGVSVRTTYKWLRRYRLGGRPALEDASSRPRRQPRRTSPETVAAIVAARHARRTAWAIATQLHVPRSTVAAVLVRVGLNRLARLAPPPPAQRYERTRPGELVHLDIKPLGRILRVGHRIRPQQRGSVGAGWEYVHVAVDDYSRAAYVEVLPDQTGATTAAFLRRTVGWFARRGIPVARVLTDNGSGYISRRFRRAADRCRVRLLRTRPYRPQTNGKAERFIQTLIRGWAYAVAYPSSWRRILALRPWVRHYNVERPHAALGYQPPGFRESRSEQPCQKSQLAIEACAPSASSTAAVPPRARVRAGSLRRRH